MTIDELVSITNCLKRKLPSFAGEERQCRVGVPVGIVHCADPREDAEWQSKWWQRQEVVMFKFVSVMARDGRLRWKVVEPGDLEVVL